MLDFLTLTAGLVGLWFGTELALRSTLVIADRTGLSQGFLGLSVLAVGTDLPELVVAITGGVHQLRGVEASGLIVGNAIGSAITQGGLVLGVAGLLGTLQLERKQLVRNGTVLLAAIALIGLCSLSGRIGRAEGFLLLAAWGAYFGFLIRAEPGASPEAEQRAALGLRPVLGLLLGLAFLLVSAEAILVAAISLAEARGWDQTAIGLVLIGAGTSLPELALSASAAAHGRNDLSVANLIGSNVFDLTVPIGASALLHPITVESATVRIDLPVLALFTVLSLIFLGWRRGIQRGEALALILLYLGFVAVRLFVT